MPITSTEELFDTSFLARLEALGLAARKLVRGRLKAERRSLVRGSSVEFAEYRPFVQGDDFRYIDWNAFARWRQLVLKLFVEEQDLYIHLLVDATPSMDFGKPLKFDYARQVAAGLMYLGLSNLDRVSMAPLGTTTAVWHPTRGRDRFLLGLRYLAGCPVAENSSALEDGVRRWQASKPHRGLVIVLSDLFGADLDDARRALDRLRYSQHEIAVIQIIDESESKAGELGEFELEDCEYGHTRRVLIDSSTAREYRRRYEDYQHQMANYCKRHQISVLQVGTKTDVIDLLLRGLTQGGFIR